MSLKAWQKRIEQYEAGAPIPESLVRALRVAAQPGTPTHDLINSKCLYDGANADHGVEWRITYEQTKKGIKWLRSHAIRELMREEEQRIVNDFSRFYFVGIKAYEYESPMRTGHVLTHYAPVYRVCGNSGEWFDYVSAPWQSGDPLGIPRFGVLQSLLCSEGRDTLRFKYGWLNIQTGTTGVRDYDAPSRASFLESLCAWNKKGRGAWQYWEEV